MTFYFHFRWKLSEFLHFHLIFFIFNFTAPFTVMVRFFHCTLARTRERKKITRDENDFHSCEMRKNVLIKRFLSLSVSLSIPLTLFCQRMSFFTLVLGRVFIFDFTANASLISRNLTQLMAEVK